MDDLDRALINTLQGGFPICERPYAEVAARVDSDEAAVIARIESLLARGLLSRFGPMYHAAQMGGALSLAAMEIPPADFDRVTDIVNKQPEVAHNYARNHRLNMWFVLATETPDAQQETIARIERETGYPVYNMPKIREYFVELKLHV
ncbi:MAG: AsnC family transcriptional regulator [Thiobacillus sp.]|jgi:DNA-binding Lrp family transcriptional regulator|uniref:Lrp/AsnC family transcriptional regulator n=1 Tax=Thiobacillus sp. TaxID=924 RepID=UPI002894F20D|nr:AsnC family transcriptional regulator [Thiobacillus sp.]MDT3707118.1 AsnC family transcriptional regulator [Thiobacillus sp.]